VCQAKLATAPAATLSMGGGRRTQLCARAYSVWHEWRSSCCGVAREGGGTAAQAVGVQLVRQCGRWSWVREGEQRARCAGGGLRRCATPYVCGRRAEGERRAAHGTGCACVRGVTVSDDRQGVIRYHPVARREIRYNLILSICAPGKWEGREKRSFCVWHKTTDQTSHSPRYPNASTNTRYE
jgi:hypothetical protein